MSEFPFVGLHGFTGAPDVFTALDVSFLWAPFLAGHGRSPNIEATSFQEEVARLAGELRKRAVSKVHLLGYSMGGRLALGLLDFAPQLFARATLIGVNPGLQSEEERESRRAWETEWVNILNNEGIAGFEERWSSLPIFASQTRLSRSQTDAQRDTRRAHTAAGLGHAMRVLGLGSMPNYWPALGAISVPVDLVFGEQDEKFARLMMQAEQLNPRFRCVSISGVGHNPLVEAPDRVRDILLAPYREDVQP